MDVGGVAQQEGPAVPEGGGHPVMDMIGREPVHPADLDVHPFEHRGADVRPAQAVLPGLRFRPHGADQARRAFGLQREDPEEVGLVQGDVQLAVHYRTFGLDIRHIEQLGVGPAGEAGAQLLSHGRAGAVASGEVGDRAGPPAPVGALELGAHRLGGLAETDQLHRPLDGHAGLLQPLDQQPLVLVLGEHQHMGEGADPLADVAELHPAGLLAPRPEVHRGEGQAFRLHRFGEAELAIELQGARLDRQGAGGGARLGRLVDDAHLDAQTRQPQGEDQPRGTGPDDQDFRIAHRPASHPASLSPQALKPERAGRRLRRGPE